MKAWIPATFLALAVHGCASTPSGPSAGSTDGIAGLARDVSFRCGTGEVLSVRFIPARGIAVLTRRGLSIELPQQPSGSGFIYSNGGNSLRGKGNDLTVELGRMAPLQCTAM